MSGSSGEYAGDTLNVPFLDEELEFSVSDLKRGEALDDYSAAFRNFLALGAPTREEAARYVFKFYQECASRIEESGMEEFELDFIITEEAGVWEYVQLYTVTASRREADGLVYIQATGNCDWEEEHGIQLVFREGKKLSRVSEQDGHLTTVDAFGLNESEDSILSPADA